MNCQQLQRRLSLTSILIIFMWIVAIHDAEGQLQQKAHATQSYQVPNRGPRLVLQQGHAGGINSLAFSPDGKLIATGGDDWVIKVWELKSGKLLKSFHVDGSWHIRMAFSPDSKVLAPFLRGGEASIWDVSIGKILKTFHQGDEPGTIAFSNDGTHIALGSASGKISIWNYRTGQQIRSIKTHADSVGSIQFSSDGKLLASAASASGFGKPFAEIWNVESGGLVKTIHTGGPVTAIAFKPVGRVIALANGDWLRKDTVVDLWDLASDKKVMKLDGPSFEVTSLSFSPEGKRLVGSDRQGLIHDWETATGTRTGSMGEREPFAASIVSTDAKLAAVGYHNGSIRIYDSRSRKQLLMVGGRSHDMDQLAVCDNGRTLISAGTSLNLKSRSNEIIFWDAQTGIRKGDLSWVTTSNSLSVSVTPNGRFLSACDSDAVTVWDIARRRVVATFRTKGEWTRFTISSISPDGSIVAIGQNRRKTDAELAKTKNERRSSDDGEAYSLELWDVKKETNIRSFDGIVGHVSVAQFTPDGKRLIANDGRVSILEWDVATGAFRTKYTGAEGSIYAMGLSANGEVLSASGDGDHIQVWNRKLGGPPVAIRVTGYNTFGLNVTPNGKQVAVAGKEGDIKVWNLNDRTLVCKSNGSGPYVKSIAFIPNSNRVAALDTERGITIWDTRSGDLKVSMSPVGFNDGKGRLDEWLTWTPVGYYQGSQNAESYFQWQAGDKLVDGISYKSDRQKPDQIEVALSGVVQGGRYERKVKEASAWQAIPQISPKPVVEEKPVLERADDPNVQLKNLVNKCYFMNSGQAGEFKKEVDGLIVKGADINVIASYGYTPLMQLSRAGSVDDVRDWLKRGAKIDLTNIYGGTALLKAVDNKNFPVVQLLLDAGADVKDRDGKSLMPLRGHPRDLGLAILDCLGGGQPILNNIYYDGVATAKLLLYFGGDPKVRDATGRYALHFTREPDMVERLLAAGLDINVLDNDGTPAYLEWAYQGDVELVKIAIRQEANLNAYNRASRTGLIFAAGRGLDNIVTMLLDAHADVNFAGKEGDNALMAALYEGHLDTVRILIARGATLEGRSSYDGRTALIIAAMKSDTEAVRILLDAGANPNAKDKDGKSVLKLVQKADPMDQFGIAALLRKHGAKE